MLTPQDVQKVSFDRSLVGGYSMQQVDEFLQPLTEDYISLYQENVVLKNKLRVLVDTLQEYQVREQSVEETGIRAREEAEALLRRTREQCDKLLADAERDARERLSGLLEELRAEQARVSAAKRASGEFVALMERTVEQQLTTLRLLKSMSARELRPQVFDYNRAEEQPVSDERTIRIPDSPAETDQHQWRGDQPNDGL